MVKVDDDDNDADVSDVCVYTVRDEVIYDWCRNLALSVVYFMF